MSAEVMFFQFQVPCPKTKTADTNAAAVAVQGSWSLMGSTCIFPMKNQDMFEATRNLKLQEKLFLSSHRILLPLVWAFCSDTNLAFTHGLIICNSKFLFTFLSHFWFVSWTCSAQLGLSSRVSCQHHHLFFHGDIWKLWALLNVKVTASVLALLFLYLSWPPGPKSMQGPCTNSLVLSPVSIGFFVSLPPFIHSIIQEKVRVPLNFKPNSWDWSCKIISNKSIDKKSTYI